MQDMTVWWIQYRRELDQTDTEPSKAEKRRQTGQEVGMKGGRQDSMYNLVDMRKEG